MHLLGTHQYRPTLQPSKPFIRYRNLSTRISSHLPCVSSILRTRRCARTVFFALAVALCIRSLASPIERSRRHAARKTLPREAPQGPPDHRCRRQGHSPFARRSHQAARCSTPPHRAFGSLNARSACGQTHPSPPPPTNSLFLQHSRQEPHPPPQTRRNVAACSRPSPSQIPSAKSIHLAHRQGHDAPSPSHRLHRPSPDTDRFSQQTSAARHRPLVKRSRFRHRHRFDTTSRAHNPYTPFPTRYV